MSSIIHEMLGVTPSVKIVSQMNENLKSDGLLNQSEKKVPNISNVDMVSIPITTSIGVSIKHKPISKWEWVKFKNTARTDSLLLYHWAKVQQSNQNPIKTHDKNGNLTLEKNADSKQIFGISNGSLSEENLKKNGFHNSYYFSKFNKHPTVYSFQSDQYNKYLKDIDSDWCEEDTCLLFDLCKEFDLRFIIIHDRYVPPSGKQRSLEQLKHRYYSVSKKLVEINFDTKRRSLGNSPDPSLLSSLKDERNRHPYIRYTYNIDLDKSRRTALLESYNEKNTRREAKKIIQEIHSKSVMNNSKRGFAQTSTLIGDLIEIEKEADEEQKLLTKLRGCDSFGPKRSGSTTAGALCYHYISSLPRRFSSDVENFLKHFKLDVFPLPYLNMELAEQYCIMRCDLLMLLSIRKKLQRLNLLKHAWQEKLRSILQNEEFGNTVNQNEHEEKFKGSLINSANRQFHISATSPTINVSRNNVQRHRSKAMRATQEQTLPGPVLHSEINISSNTSQMQNSTDILKRDIDLNDKPRKRSKSNISRYITHQNGLINQSVTKPGSFQVINGQTIISPGP